MMTVNKKMYVVVIGCGRLGSHLAATLSGKGHSVVAVDAHYSAFDALSSEFSGFKYEADATEFAALKQAKIERADLLIATTDDDNINIMVAQVAAKLFNVPRVIARVEEPEKEAIYSSLGIETICPASLAGRVFIESLTTI
jgi:trk system potassium uptake protein TrkA